VRHEFFYFSDDGDLTGFRDDRFKYHYALQEVTGPTVWMMPLTRLRLPLIVDLKSDPYENALLGGSVYYYSWLGDHAFLIVPAIQKVAAYLKTYKDFPPRQRPATFSIDQVIEQLEAGVKGK